MDKGRKGALRRAYLKMVSTHGLGTPVVEIYPDRRVAFVPAERGRFIRTHICAAWMPCRACGAERGRPCRATAGPNVDELQVPVHVERRNDYYDEMAKVLADNMPRKV